MLAHQPKDTFKHMYRTSLHMMVPGVYRFRQASSKRHRHWTWARDDQHRVNRRSGRISRLRNIPKDKVRRRWDDWTHGDRLNSKQHGWPPTLGDKKKKKTHFILPILTVSLSSYFITTQSVSINENSAFWTDYWGMVLEMNTLCNRNKLTEMHDYDAISLFCWHL